MFGDINPKLPGIKNANIPKNVWSVGSTGISSGYGGDGSANNFTLGNYSLSYGASSTRATGLSSFAMGSGSLASGIYSIAFGSNTCTSSSNYSFSFGMSCVASNFYTFAFGNTSTSTNNNDFSFGNSCQASGGFSFAFGSSCKSQSTSSFSFGNSCTTSATYSFAFGFTCVTNGSHSFAMGVSATTTNNGSVVWGDNNSTPVTDSAANQWNTTFAGGYWWYLNNTPTLAVNIDTLGNLTNRLGECDKSKLILTPTTGTTITLVTINRRTLLNPSGTLLTLTINMPPSPVDGQLQKVTTTQAVTTLTVSGNGNSIIGAPTSLIVGQSFEMIYNIGDTTWYPA